MTIATDRLWRAIAARLALLGVLLYASLVPWHVAQRQATLSVASELDRAALASFCHGGATTPGAPGSLPDGPSPGTDCPICQGLVAAAVILANPPVLPLPPADAGASLAATNQDVASSFAIAPRSRGPPDLA